MLTLLVIAVMHVGNQQTALLREIAANTHTPIAVEVSGFSPEAQQVFNKAVKAKGRK